MFSRSTPIGEQNTCPNHTAKSLFWIPSLPVWQAEC